LENSDKKSLSNLANVSEIYLARILTQKVKYNILDISDLNSGIYLLKISQNEKSTIKKLMVK
jgi:hypothetical protein